MFIIASIRIIWYYIQLAPAYKQERELHHLPYRTQGHRPSVVYSQQNPPAGTIRNHLRKHQICIHQIHGAAKTKDKKTMIKPCFVHNFLPPTLMVALARDSAPRHP